MQCFHITGGTPLKGHLKICGAKNAALPLLTLGLLTEEPLVLKNVPQLADVDTIVTLLETLGCVGEIQGDQYTVHTKTLTTSRASYDIVRKMRASVLVLGALVGKWGEGEVSLPGGCAIGLRPLDLHMEGLKALGIDITLEHGYILARAPRGGIPGGNFCFPKATVTGSLNVIFAAVLAKGESCLMNVAQEPEIDDVICCLNKMGAHIEKQGASTLWIKGVEKLHGTEHHVISDRIEMGTFMAAAAMTQGDLILQGGDLSLLPGVVSLLKAAGVEIEAHAGDIVRVKSPGRPKSFSFSTQPYPGFPTDLQAQFMALATLAEGTSYISENIWENRFMHVSELCRLGAKISVQGNEAIIEGQPRLMGARVMATDLRASVGLVLAGMAAEGVTEILRIYHLDRGYENLENRLNQCGAHIVRSTYLPEPEV